MTKLALFLGALGLLFSGWLTFILLGSSPWSTFSDQGAQLMGMVWGRISLLDLYAGFFLALALVWLLEPKLWVKILVSLTLPTLGNPVLAIWCVLRIKHLLALSRSAQISEPKL